MAPRGPLSLLLLTFAFCGRSSGQDNYFKPSPLHSGSWVESTRGQPWPRPAFLQQRSDEVSQLDPNGFIFILDSAAAACQTLTDSLPRFYDRLFPPSLGRNYQPPTRGRRARDSTFDWLSIQLLGDCEVWPHSQMTETYSLNVDATSSAESFLLSNSVWGIIRGLETFSQLVYFDESNQFSVNSTIVEDYPRFPFRGFMLDTSRHFLTTSVLLDTLDLMEMNKMNVFHWHMTDDPSFPYQSTTFPELSGSGAFEPQTHVYTQADVASILEAARLRGIRVIPEFDTPGHTLSWGNGVPELLTVCYEEDGQTPAGYYGPMDPTQEYVYSFLNSFFQEMSGVFPDEYLHLGGDEVDFACWASNPYINETMVAWGNQGDYSGLQSYFVSRLLDIFNAVGKKSIVWEEVFENGDPISTDTIVDVWKAWEGWEDQLQQITSLKQPAILSAPWYLNYISYGSDWVPYYKVEPLNFTSADPSDKDYVLGGEACLWGEFVDSTNVIARSWPRASAVAERLWSPADVMDEWEAAGRLQEHQCRMVARGHQVQPIDGAGFCTVEWEEEN